jgi:hypothetical protein
MKKDLQKVILASIIGSLAVMTGCGQKNDNGMMKSPAKPKTEEEAKSWYDEGSKNMKMEKESKNGSYNNSNSNSNYHNGCE